MAYTRMTLNGKTETYGNREGIPTHEENQIHSPYKLSDYFSLEQVNLLYQKNFRFKQGFLEFLQKNGYVPSDFKDKKGEGSLEVIKYGQIHVEGKDIIALASLDRYIMIPRRNPLESKNWKNGRRIQNIERVPPPPKGPSLGSRLGVLILGIRNASMKELERKNS